MTALLVLFAALNVLDGWLTYKILRAGGYEMMPAAGSLIKRFGLKRALLWLKVATIAGIWIWAFNGLAPQVMAWMCVAFGLIVVWNFFQWRKSRG